LKFDALMGLLRPFIALNFRKHASFLKAITIIYMGKVDKGGK
jgi:hypothetical protein